MRNFKIRFSILLMYMVVSLFYSFKFDVDVINKRLSFWRIFALIFFGITNDRFLVMI